MGHDASKIMLGSSYSSDKESTCHDADPADFPAGRAVRQSDEVGGLSLAVADGQLIGVSIGKSLSDHKKTSVLRAGNQVPLEIAAALHVGDLTFVAKRAVPIAIEFLDSETAGMETVTVTGDDDAGYLISVGMEDDESSATEIKTALDADEDAAALIETIIDAGQGAVDQLAFPEDDIDDYSHAEIGAAVEVSNVTGKAVPAACGSATAAIYRSAALDALDPYTGELPFKAAAIDMGGGL